MYAIRSYYGVTAKSHNPLIRLVHQERFERPTYGFVVRCSIQLSYWCRKVVSIYSRSILNSSLFFANLVFFSLMVENIIIHRFHIRFANNQDFNMITVFHVTQFSALVILQI